MKYGYVLGMLQGYKKYFCGEKLRKSGKVMLGFLAASAWSHYETKMKWRLIIVNMKFKSSMVQGLDDWLEGHHLACQGI